jgi:hypothetical protein
MRIEDALPLISQLSTEDKLRLIDLLAKQLLEERQQAAVEGTRRIYGLLNNQEQAPSQEEIQQARRKMWSKFPREDL